MSEAFRIHEDQRARIIGGVPAWYRPAPHLAFPTVLGGAVMVAAAASLRSPRLLELLAIPATLLFAFAFEWQAHKSVLHKRQPGLGVIYERHELNHHVVFTNEDMAMRSGRELWLILMPAYAVLLVFMINAPIAAALAWLLSTNVALLFLATSMAFFLSYEWMHMAYHLPKDSFIGRNALVGRLREHHRRHHEPRLMKRWNFNVTIPVFDVVHRTVWSPEREDEQRAARRAPQRAGA